MSVAGVPAGRLRRYSAGRYSTRARVLWLGVSGVAMAVGGAYAAAIIASEGQPLLIAPVAGTIAGIALFAYPRVGLYLLFAAAVLLEQWPIVGLEPITAQSHVFENISNYTGLPIRLSVSDLLAGLTLLSWALRRAVGVERPPLRTPLNLAVLGYVLAFVLGLLIGLARGGSWNLSAALAELRGPLYLGVFFLLAASLLRTRSQILIALWAFLALVGVKALQGLLNYQVMLSGPRWLYAVTGHEDVVFFDAALVLMLSAVVILGRTRLTYFALALAPVTLAAEFLTQRRVAFIALAAALAVAGLLLLVERRRRAIILLAASLFGFSIYGVLFWENQGLVGQPIRAVRAAVAPETVSSRDRFSDWWRDIENGNITFTIEQLPLTGVGLGQEYLFKREPPQLTGFAYWRYWTHNAIFWVWLKAGPIGFFALWYLVAQGLILGARLFRAHQDRELKLVALLALTLLVAQTVYSTVDLGLTFSRPMIVLGSALGLLPPLMALVRAPADRQ